MRDEHSQKVQQLEGEKRILQQEKQKDLAIQNALRKEFDRSEQIIEELKQVCYKIRCSIILYWGLFITLRHRIEESKQFKESLKLSKRNLK